MSPHLAAAAKALPQIKTKPPTFSATLVNLLPHMWQADRPDLKMRVVYAVGLLFLAKVITLFMPFTAKWATDALTMNVNSVKDITPELLITLPILLTLLYGVARILIAVLTQMRDAMFAKVSMNAVRNMATRTFDHMHRLSLRFHLDRKTGGLTRVLERGRAGIEMIVRMVMMNGVPTLLEFALVLAVLGWEFDWRYVAVVFVTILAYGWFTYTTTEWRIGIRKTMNESDNEANTKAIDSLLNYETVKYFGAEKREGSRYDQSMARYEGANIKALTSLAYLNGGQAIIFTIGLTICLVMSSLDIIAGKATLGGFVMINAMMIQLYMPLNFLGMLYREIKQAMIDIDQMVAILDQPQEIVDKKNAPSLDVKNAAIKFENVSFSYEKERQILNNISFEIPSGKTLAVVGASGAGKSTLSRLLFRFYDIQSGKIMIDGTDIRDVTQTSLRSSLGIVPQDTVLFNDTVFYNIKYGRWDATDEEVYEAARMAQIHDFIISTPKGYKTEVGERGLKLSGGEKQRVAIARTLLKNPPILVLDEATSALDTNTEKEIKESLDKISKNRTTLVIAHRLSTIVDSDQIIVLNEGEIAERGTHNELLELQGLYYGLWNRQRDNEEEA